MLRRLPTALTISPEDVQTYDAQLARHLAYLHYKRTGEDPEGLFTSSGAPSQPQHGPKLVVQDSFDKDEREKTVDPNDELKPLPGDKARIVRGREERILGVPGARGGR